MLKKGDLVAWFEDVNEMAIVLEDQKPGQKAILIYWLDVELRVREPVMWLGRVAEEGGNDA